jgi:2-C-methyl-D-erythritol 2,4-cyclodiphosphate synthase
MRTGIGFDIHRLVPSIEATKIPIGGVGIPCKFGVKAHSDGDVLLHALTDSLLGAMALGDIGQWFPDNADENRNRSSEDFVRVVLAEITRMGWQVSQLDSTIFLEEPKLKPYHFEIRQSLAKILGVELSQVSVKAKTYEGLGAIGERQAIAAQVVVNLVPTPRSPETAANRT